MEINTGFNKWNVNVIATLKKMRFLKIMAIPPTGESLVHFGHFA